MAKQEVIVTTCDKCGFEEVDTTKFLHITVSPVWNHKGRQPKPISDRDLCESCVGLPGVNRDK